MSMHDQNELNKLTNEMRDEFHITSAPLSSTSSSSSSSSSSLPDTLPFTEFFNVSINGVLEILKLELQIKHIQLKENIQKEEEYEQKEKQKKREKKKKKKKEEEQKKKKKKKKEKAMVDETNVAQARQWGLVAFKVPHGNFTGKAAENNAYIVYGPGSADKAKEVVAVLQKYPASANAPPPII